MEEDLLEKLESFDPFKPLPEAKLAHFLKPEFVGKNPKNYEVRDDGVVVRKDRWERGIRSIYYSLREVGLVPKDDFEIQDAVDAVKALCLPLIKEDDDDND